jgi:hypothetical protein
VAAELERGRPEARPDALGAARKYDSCDATGGERVVAERVATPIRGSVVDFGAFNAMLAFQKLVSSLQGVSAVVKVAHTNTWTPTYPRLALNRASRRR